MFVQFYPHMDKTYTWLYNKFNLVIFRIDRISLAVVGATLNRVSPTSRHPTGNGSCLACPHEPGLSHRLEMAPQAQEAGSSPTVLVAPPGFVASLRCWA